MRIRHFSFAVALASLAALPALAAEPSVPRTGSEQSITVPHALPGEQVHRSNEGQHLTSPTGTQPTAAERGPTVPNAFPGQTTAIDESRPHVDVTAPPGVVPSTGAEQGANPPNSR